MKIQKKLICVVAFLFCLISSATIASALPTCADLAVGLQGNPDVFSVTSAELTTTGGRSYCMVNVTWQDPKMVGSAAGYANPPSPDSFQSIKIGIALPDNTNTGDAAWGGRLIMTAGGGAQGTVPSLTSMIGMTPAAIGAGTDSGHDGGMSWGVIMPPYTPLGLNYGKIKDWAGGRSNGIAVKLAKHLAKIYYGVPVRWTYWNGCSGGGHMGWAQVQNYPEEYDGALIGAPAFFWQQFRLADSWDAVVKKKVAQQTTAITAGQVTAANVAATAACAYVDGIVADPRACTWSATNNICGQPGAPAAPNCLNAIQAAGIDRIWDGPHNSYGIRIWGPYDRGINRGAATTVTGSTVQVMQWNHADLTFNGNNLYEDQESINLAAAAGIDVTKAITYENEAMLGSHTTNDFTDDFCQDLDAARRRGMKIIGYHGTQDPAIIFRDDIDFYLRVATYFGHGEADFERLQHWYRLFLVPGAPHCPAVPQALPALMNWVENGVAPDSLVQTTLIPKLCPFPQWAIYNGTGSTTDAASFTCGGNLDANPVALCEMLHTKYKHENEASLNNCQVDIDPDHCPGVPRKLRPKCNEERKDLDDGESGPCHQWQLEREQK